MYSNQSAGWYWKIQTPRHAISATKQHFAVVRRAFPTMFSTVTKLAEIQEAILQLDPKEQQVLRHWLDETAEETPEMLAALDEGIRSLANEPTVPIEEGRRRFRANVRVRDDSSGASDSPLQQHRHKHQVDLMWGLISDTHGTTLNVSMALRASSSEDAWFSASLLQVTHAVTLRALRYTVESYTVPLKLFLSHASLDKPFVEDMKRFLEQGGEIECWLDIYEIGYGDNIASRIDYGLRECGIALLFLSPASMESKWVREEWTAA